MNKNNEKKQQHTKNNNNKTNTKESNTIKTTNSKKELVKDSVNNNLPVKKQAKKKHCLGKWITLLLAIIGTVLGVYSVNQLNTVKVNINNLSNNKEQVITINNKITKLEQKLDNNKKLLNDSAKKIEQLQKKLKILEDGNLNNSSLSQLKSRLNSLFTKINENEQKIHNLTKKSKQANLSVRKYINTIDMTNQEIGYLLRMANNKIYLEKNVSRAIDLLQIIKNKLLAKNDDNTNTLITAINDKIAQLMAVKNTDTKTLIDALRDIEKSIIALSITTEKITENDKNNRQNIKNKGVLDKIGTVIASGIKYTAKDNSNINMSAKDMLIEKRLIQYYIKMSELAIRSHDDSLLLENIQSIKNSLTKYFSYDNAAKSINNKLTQLSEKVKAKTPTPDLLELINLFQTIL